MSVCHNVRVHCVVTLAHCGQQWGATNDNISINTGYFCGASFGMSLLGIWEGILDVRMHIVCTNHATNEIGVLTVCHDEQPYLLQNKIFLWHFVGFVITQNKDKHWDGLNRGYVGKIKWNVPFILTCPLISHGFCIMFTLWSWNWKLQITQDGNLLPDSVNDTLLS